MNKSVPPNTISLDENFFLKQTTLKPRNLQFLIAFCKILVIFIFDQCCTGNKIEEIQILERQSSN